MAGALLARVAATATRRRDPHAIITANCPIYARNELRSDGDRGRVTPRVTCHPTDAGIAQQLREATPFGTAPSYLIRDNDHKYGPAFDRVAAGSRITVQHTPVRAPRANGTCERFLGSVRRECLDHLPILGERHLARVLREYVTFFNRARPHQGLGQALPEPSPREMASRAGPIRALPVLGGLHHTYQRAA